MGSDARCIVVSAVAPHTHLALNSSQRVLQREQFVYHDVDVIRIGALQLEKDIDVAFDCQ